MSDDAKRAALNIRTTTALKDRLQSAGVESGRTMSQEADLRLEQSFAREDDVGSRAVAILADFTRLAASIIEAKTGKRWTDDADTYFRVSQAIRSFMAANHPPDTADMTELDEAVAELKQLKSALDGHQGLMNALRGEPTDTSVIEAHTKALERVDAALKRHQAASERNREAGQEAAATLGHIFQLAPVKEGTRRGSTLSRPVPRVMRVQKRAEPRSTRQRA